MFTLNAYQKTTLQEIDGILKQENKQLVVQNMKELVKAAIPAKKGDKPLNINDNCGKILRKLNSKNVDNQLDIISEVTAVVKVASLIGTLAVIDYQLTTFITKTFATELGLCLGNLVSTPIKKTIASFITPLASINAAVGRLFGNNITGDILIPAACEELEFRWFVQKILLRELPKNLLKHFAPEHINLVDSPAARISRISLAALLFAFAHSHTLDCSTGGGISGLIGGLMYGTVYEYTDLVYPILLHGAFNFVDRM